MARMNCLHANLCRICRQHLLEEKWLLAPSLRIGNQWLEAAARASGQPLVNVRVKTLKGLAIELAGPTLAERGLSVLPEQAGPLVIGLLWPKLRQSGDGYLGRLQAGPRLFEALYRSVRALRLADLSAERLDRQHFEVPAKGAELAELLAAYTAELGRRAWADYSAVLALAADRLDRQPLPERVLVLVPDDVQQAVMERRMLAAIAAGQRLTLAVDEPDGTEGEPTGAANGPSCAGTRPPGRRGPAAPRSASPSAEPRDERPGLHFFHAVGEINEVRGVLRRCLANGLRLDEVELLHTDPDTYVPLIYETAARLWAGDGQAQDQLPITFAEGIPSRYSRPGRALAGWLAWLKEDYPQATLARMLQDGLLRVSLPDGVELSFARLAAIFRAMAIGWGRQRYLPVLQDSLAGLRSRAERQAAGAIGPEEEDEAASRSRAEQLCRRLAATEALHNLVAELLRLSPASPREPAELLRAAGQFLTRHARCANELDNLARQRLVQEIERMTELLEQMGASADDGLAGDSGGGRASEPTAAAAFGPNGCFDPAEWLASLPDTVRIGGSGPQPGRLHAAYLLSGGHSGRPNTFIVGLDDGRFPGTGAQDPLLLDEERRALSAGLETGADRLQRRLDQFAHLLARLRGSVTLSYSCRNLEDDREQFPSPVLLGAYRAVSGNPGADQDELVGHLGQPVSFAPSDSAACLDSGEWWLWRLSGPETVADPVNLVYECFDHLGRGARLAQLRADSLLSEADGWLPRAGPELDPTRPDGPVMSASRLELLGRCPLAYFFRYVLELEEPEELDYDPDRWLDPLQMGGLLHTVFYDFMSELTEQRRRPSLKDHLPRLHELLEGVINQYLDQYPPPNQSAYQRQRRELLRAVRTFLASEQELCQSSQPRYLEAAIGLPPQGGGTQLDCRQPGQFALPGGQHVRVCARIDRVDQLLDGSFAIWDYKSGGTYKYDHSPPFNEGRVVQHAVYLAVAEQRLRQVFGPAAEVRQFGFFFPGVRGRGRRRLYRRDQLAVGSEVVAQLCQLAAAGCFCPTNNADDCSFCDYLAICRDPATVAAASARKLRDEENTVLEPLRSLRGVKLPSES